MTGLILLIALFASACDRSAGARGDAQAAAPKPPRVEVVRVASQRLVTQERSPAELLPWQAVAIYSKVQGFVEEIPVDRGSVVRQGQLLCRLAAPELLAQTAQAEATLRAESSTFQRLQDASNTKGAVSANELEVSRQTAAADRERVRSLKALANYLTITAPFDGVITERNVHPGALVGPPAEPLKGAVPLLRLDAISHLRLTVPVPEADAGAVAAGTSVKFAVRAWPGRTFTGIISRISHSLDVSTRTMAVEADVDNDRRLLDPGMYCEVLWPVYRDTDSLFVPAGSIVDTTQASFVDRVRGDRVDRVTVQRGKTMGDLIEVFGQLRPGDLVLAQGSEELADGARVESHISQSSRRGDHRSPSASLDPGS